MVDFCGGVIVVLLLLAFKSLLREKYTNIHKKFPGKLAKKFFLCRKICRKNSVKFNFFIRYFSLYSAKLSLNLEKNQKFWTELRFLVRCLLADVAKRTVTCLKRIEFSSHSNSRTSTSSFKATKQPLVPKGCYSHVGHLVSFLVILQIHT